MQLEKVMIPIKSLGIELEAHYQEQWSYTQRETVYIVDTNNASFMFSKCCLTKEEALADVIKVAEEWTNKFLITLRANTNDLEEALKEILQSIVFDCEQQSEDRWALTCAHDLFTIAIACYKKVLKEIS